MIVVAHSRMCVLIGNMLCLFDRKKILAEYKVPAKQVTSASFGGPKLDDLFVTTAAKNLAGPQEEPAGAVFKISGIGAKGLAMNEVVLKD